MMSTQTPPDPAQLRALLDAATATPWTLNKPPSDAVHPSNVYAPGRLNRNGKPSHVATVHTNPSADAALIVAAVNGLPGLLARVEAAEAENEQLRGINIEINDGCVALERERDALRAEVPAPPVYHHIINHGDGYPPTCGARRHDAGRASMLWHRVTCAACLALNAAPPAPEAT